MKKCIILITLALISLNVFAQTNTKKEIGDIFSNTIVEQVEGTIVLERDIQEKKVMTYIVSLSDMYDKQYYMSSIYSLVDSYNDVHFLSPWKKTNSGIYESSIFIKPEKYANIVIVLRYSLNDNQIMIGFYYGDNKNVPLNKG